MSLRITNEFRQKTREDCLRMTDGIGFAIPVNLVRGGSQQLRENGRAIRGWLGVSPQNLSPQRAADLDLGDVSGIELYDVSDNGPGYRAGLRPGDIITHIDGAEIMASREALNLVAGLSPGSLVMIDGIRDGRSFQIQVRIEERPLLP